MAVAQPKIGLFAGIFNKDGRLLIKRRGSGESLAGEWDLPGGGVEAYNNAKATDERIIGQELVREVMEEVGLKISIKFIVPMYPVVIKGGSDWAFLIYVGEVAEKPTKGETRWVSLDELNRLAKGPEGNRLVSGWGKRMHRLCLMAFILGPGFMFPFEAGMILNDKILASWVK